jgi:hypothetical protein
MSVAVHMRVSMAANVPSKRDRRMPRRRSNHPQGLPLTDSNRLTRVADAIAIAGVTAAAVSEHVCHAVRHNLASGRIFVLVRMRMPPQNELLNDKEHAETHHQRDANRVCAAGSNSFHRFWQQSQQRRTDQRARGEAHEVGQHPKPSPLRKQQEKPRERGARNAADRGEQDYRAEKGQGRSALVTPSLTF